MWIVSPYCSQANNQPFRLSPVATAYRREARRLDRAVVVFVDGDFAHNLGAVFFRVFHDPLDVVDFEGYILDAVAVLDEMLAELPILRQQRALEDENNLNERDLQPQR